MDLSSLTIENFGSICRTCLQRGPMSSIFVQHKKFSVKFSEMLYYCATLEANESDRLPLQMCKKCTTSLVSYYKFRNNAIKSDLILRRIIVDAQNNTKVEKRERSPSPALSELDYDTSCLLGNPDSPDEQPESKIIPSDEDTKDITPVVLFEIKNRDEELVIPKPTTKRYQCDTCGKFLSCRSNLNQHIRRHTGEKPFACDFCEKRFARAEHVVTHRRIHTGERPHSCTICQKSFVQYAALSAHLRVHTGERPHMCAICGKAFSQAVSLTYHTRTHTGETPFMCKICNKGFAHSGNLNIHMRFHLNERPFVCNMCGKRFVTSSHLTVHIKQHTGDKPHKCKLCGKAFARSEHLKDHLVIHTGQKPHACKLCPKRYTQSSHLSRHMKTHKI